MWDTLGLTRSASMRLNMSELLEESSNHGTLIPITERPYMRRFQHSRLLNLLLALWLSTAICTPSLAEDMALLSIGPRIGFSEKIPLMGKEQKYYFHLYDVAAVFKLPWSWPLGESPWSLETRLIASAGLLTGANESGLMVTARAGSCAERLGGTCHLRRRSWGRILQQLSSSAYKTSEVRFKSSRPRGFA